MASSTSSPALTSGPRRRLQVSVHWFLIALVALFVAAAGAGTAYGWRSARDDARDRAIEDAAFAAQLGARAIADDLAVLQTTVATTAAQPALADVLAGVPGCALSFGVGDVFESGHIDVVAADGTVMCTSLPTADAPAGYAGEAWLTDATAGPVLVGPVVDPRTGGASIVAAAPVAAAPVAGQGALAGFYDTATIGEGLAALLGGPRQLEFVVTDGTTSISRSIDADRWDGVPLADTSFDPASTAVERRDLDGTRRYYASAEVEGLGWTLHVGADRDAALSDAASSFRRSAAIIGGGLLLCLLAALVAYRQITRPILRLSRDVRAATHGERVDLHHQRGAREVVGLSDDFRELLASVERELLERRAAEDATAASEARYRALFAGHPLPMWLFDTSTRAVIEVNEAAIQRYGYTRAEFLAMTAESVPLGSDPSDEASVPLEAAGPAARRARHIARDGSPIDVEVKAQVMVLGDREVCLVSADDVTERDRLEAQLRQSQRLESLGQLAGGVAHDFNNLLNVMLNYAGFVEANAAAALANDAAVDTRWQEVHDDAAQVIRSVERATALTRQLLAFARRDVVRPVVLQVPDLVGGVEQLLRRTLGDDIDLRTTLADARPVHADPGQLEQILVNLAVNARDAMPDGGALEIAVDDLDVDGDYTATHLVTPGTYVRIRVSDTGVGMDRETVERAFEPFFTTKDIGSGTGLGLATVYGIVTRANGHVEIYSEPGLGTTVSVLLPATTAAVDDPAEPRVEPVVGGDETILVVEDRDDLRATTERILTARGYRVLTATDGPTAVAIAERSDHPIDLVLTDVILAGGLDGGQTASRLADVVPGAKVLFMSGYAQPVLTARVTLPEGALLIEKPFTATTLLARVRAALDGDQVTTATGAVDPDALPPT
jgi:PAS domain S-box-containing protein